MLLYNKVIDPYHTSFRMINICYILTNDVLEYDRLRIYDFLLAFPSHILNSRLPRNLTKQKNTFKKYVNTYNNYDAKISFDNMKSIQETVILHLVKMSILKKIENKNEFLIQKEHISEEFIELINNSKSLDISLLEMFNTNFNELSLYGKDGLKSRTNLLEFKYDAV